MGQYPFRISPQEYVQRVHRKTAKKIEHLGCASHHLVSPEQPAASAISLVASHSKLFTLQLCSPCSLRLLNPGFISLSSLLSASENSRVYVFVTLELSVPGLCHPVDSPSPSYPPSYWLLSKLGLFLWGPSCLPIHILQNATILLVLF